MQEGSRSGFLSDLRAVGKIALWDQWPVNADCVGDSGEELNNGTETQRGIRARSRSHTSLWSMLSHPLLLRTLDQCPVHSATLPFQLLSLGATSPTPTSLALSDPAFLSWSSASLIMDSCEAPQPGGRLLSDHNI